jgi:hypothetical protein
LTCAQKYEQDFPELGGLGKLREGAVIANPTDKGPEQARNATEQEPDSLGTLAMYEEAQRYQGDEYEEEEEYDEEEKYDNMGEAMDLADLREGAC